MTKHHGSASAAVSLDRVAAIIRSRAQHHGDAVAQHAALAALITPYLRKRLGVDVALTASDAAYICLLLKVSRIEAGGMQMQHAEDIAGYAGIVMACLSAEMMDTAAAVTKADVPRFETPGQPGTATVTATFSPEDGEEDAPPTLTMRNRNHRGEIHEREIYPGRVWYGISDFHAGPQWFLTAGDPGRGVTREFALADCNFALTDALMLAPSPPFAAPGSLPKGVKVVAGGVYRDRTSNVYGVPDNPYLARGGPIYWCDQRMQFETGAKDSTNALMGWTEDGRATNGNSQRDLVSRVK
jgi:hypothetical protein